MEYKFEAERFDALKEKVEKINKKFDKPVIKLEVISSEFVSYSESIEHIITFDISFDTVVNDWEVVAKKTLEDNVVMVHTFTDDKIPDIRNHDFHCDHCHTSKAKKHLYLIHNRKTDEYKYVGKACMKEFIGTAVNRFFREESAIAQFLDLSNFYEMMPKYTYVSVKAFLSAALELAMDGEEYINRNLANYERIPSSTDKVREMIKHTATVNPKVDEVIEWFISSNQNSDKEFILNAVEIVKQEYVVEKLAEYIDLETEKVAKLTYENAQRLFKI